MPISLIRRFLRLESASGILLFVVAVLAILWANSSLAYLHKLFVDEFLFLINDGLMTLFFLLVGLELKREYLRGQLSRLSQIALPGIAAIGGMIVPALIFLAINFHSHATLQAWATPVATDIAFALGVLSLFGRRIPVGLKLFLLALAIFDDVGAIIIIALFYSQKMSVIWLLLSALLAFFLYLLNRFSVRSLTPYLSLSLVLWVCLLNAGVHPTLTGIILALSIPGDVGDKDYSQPMLELENNLHPWVAFLIMPVFALSNAGFSFAGITTTMLESHLVLGIFFGLFIGKQVGVFLFSWITIKMKLARLPDNSSWLQLYGIALICGIGFTMSLFLGTLSFPNDSIYLAEMRIGVFSGSLVSGLIGALVLLSAKTRKKSLARMKL